MFCFVSFALGSWNELENYGIVCVKCTNPGSLFSLILSTWKGEMQMHANNPCYEEHQSSLKCLVRDIVRNPD